MKESEIEINKAICEGLGRTYHLPTDEEMRSGSYYQYAPNYCGDLNEVAQVEKSLTNDEQLEYAEYLTSNFTEEFCDLAGTREHIFACATLTAKQRAEALLLVITNRPRKQKGLTWIRPTS